jgi:heavy metal sensor kinase
VGYSEESLRAFLERLLAATLLALPVILAAAGFAGYGLARRALAPLEQMARRAGEITPSSLAERLPVRNTGDELDQLAGVINSMLARLDQSFEQLRRFTSDASHELRTPLAAIRSVGEVGMQTDGTREHYREVVGSMLEEVNRLTRLVDSLLTMSRADAGQLQLHPSVFPVMELARESSQLFEVLLEEKNQHLTISGDENVRVEGDRLFLRQALMNLIHNAIKFSPLGGTIAVRIRAEEPSRVVVEISDSGPGIPPEHAPRVFDRFYRVDQSRSRDEGGTGLGLSIARWAIEVNGGTIGLRKSSTAGSTFQILLPAVSSRG